ncbi:MAG TPA: hypothetical protein P5330_09210, partial [Candidatus Competibacteraceae bacterium]|nr:hypothetical protein [Candidatus Competibacteraceae bacterium]
VIRCLSMGVDEKTGTIGRIDYGNLGVVQLGAVYEGLLSWKGFFATENLIQVCSTKNQKMSAGDEEAGDDEEDDADAVSPPPRRSAPAGVLDDAIPADLPTWFVPEALKDVFRPGEIILERRTGKPRIYRKGEFILHLNGIDRAETASYYTPEVLTEALVREVLAARLRDITPDRADEILVLTLCEPAMGSAAFINEATRQLAHAYLNLKQQQTGQTIAPDRYEDEHRRVRHWIATRNVYGVDLNPTAVELGALSLWLGSMHRLRVSSGKTPSPLAGEGWGGGDERSAYPLSPMNEREDVAGVRSGPDLYRLGAVPWFGLRLRTGNSLIGARRAVWKMKQLTDGDFFGKDAVIPRLLAPGEPRGADEVYHFLVWDEDMAPAARDKRMKAHWPAECARVTEWQKKQVRKKWTGQEAKLVLALSARIDALWAAYAAERHGALEKSACTASVWPTPSESTAALKLGPTLARQEAVKAKLEAESGPFQRLKLVMDAWCGLWFWPLDWATELPSRDAWLASIQLLLETVKLDPANLGMMEVRVGNAFNAQALYAATINDGTLDAEEAAGLVPWFAHGRNVLKDQPFHHWELVFPEVLGPAYSLPSDVKQAPHGFDLMFGNPPWLKVSWNDAPVLAEWQPLLGVRGAKSAQYSEARSRLLQEDQRRTVYRDRFSLGEGESAFLNSPALYPALAGVQTNLYKNFIERSWGLLSPVGVAGLLHPEGVFDDPKGGEFREQYYQRLLAHYQMKNEKILFADVDHHMAFSLNIYRGQSTAPRFVALFNAVDPITITASQRHNRLEDPIPGIKNDNGEWETRGHCQRLVNITEAELSLFARLFEKPDTPALQARLPQVHSREILAVLRKFTDAPRRLGDLEGEYLATEMFHEAYSQRDGIITRQDAPSFQPQSADQWVLSGPHFYVGNPFNKTPRTACTANGHYDVIDLTAIPDDFLPRAV